MTLFAVHYAWIDGQAVKAPVGIWSEDGSAYYPADCEQYRSGGLEAKNHPALFTWQGWIEMRTDWPSTYGASWVGVETDAPMDAALDHIRAEFFAVEHPTKTIQVPDAVPSGADANEGGNESETVPPHSEPELDPAFRHTSAQAWWIASELVVVPRDVVIV